MKLNLLFLRTKGVFEMQKKLYLLFFLAAIGFTSTQDLLISKFQKVLSQLPDEDKSKDAITLRLADLLSERARKKSMEELNNDCTVCTAGEADRKHAVELYQGVLPRLKGKQLSRVLSHVGHLHELNGNVAKAQTSYTKVASGNYSDQDKTEALFSMAEMEFKNSNYSKSLSLLKKVIKDSNYNKLGLANYRLAWSYHRTGDFANASKSFEAILNSPKLLTRVSRGGVVNVDKQFKGEVARDWIGSMIQLPTSDIPFKKLFGLSPDKDRLNNLGTLAIELERLGKHNKSIEVWNFVQGKIVDPVEKLRGFTYLAQLYLFKKDLSKVEKYFAKASSQKKLISNCDTNEKCSTLKTQLYNILVDWNKSEKSKPSTQLLASYKSYLSAWPNDQRVATYLGQNYRTIGDFPNAIAQLRAAFRVVPRNELKTKGENILLQIVELSEESKNEELRKKAYNEYLKLSPVQAKSFEIRYQLAYLSYQRKEYKQSSEEFYKIANSKNGPIDIRKKSADLALDSLAVLQDNSTIQKWSTEFSTLFPKSSADFVGINNKAILSSAETIFKSSQNSSSKKDLKNAYNELAKIDIASMTNSERETVLNNKLVVANKIDDFSLIKNTSNQILADSTLSTKIRNSALISRARCAEMEMDFAGAYKFYKAIPPSATFSQLQKSQKLIFLSELSGADSSIHKQELLNVSSNNETKFSIAYEMIKKSNNLEADLSKYRNHLILNKTALSHFLLDSYVKGKLPGVNNWINSFGLHSDPNMKLISEQRSRKLIDQAFAAISSHKIETSDQNLLGSSLKSRFGQLTDLENQLANVIASNDFVSQVALIKILGDQYERIYNEIIALPVPEELTPEQQSQYLAMIDQQANPHKIKANEFKQKLNEVWSNSDSTISQFQSSLNKQESRDIQNFLLAKITWLTKYSPSSEVSSKLQTVKIVPSSSVEDNTKLAMNKDALNKIQKFKDKLRSNPYDSKLIKSYLKVEEQLGRKAMVDYLNHRLELANKKGSTSI